MEKLTKEEFFRRFNYKATDKIGGGSFGQVFKAEDDVLNKIVAIKVSPVQVLGSKQFSLLDEFEALKDVKAHRNIANYEELYTYEMHNGIYDFAIMQYYPDGNLGEFLKNTISNKVKEQIAIDLLKGIVHLHKNKVVHRDLKPSNILIVRKNKEVIPKITDFGLSKKANLDSNTRFDNSFEGGTLAYSSPEQLKGEDLRLNTDLWAYGVIVYEIFIQEPLFFSKNTSSANSNGEIFDQVNSKELSNSILKLPLKWQKVVTTCLERDAEKREKSAITILKLVEQISITTKEETQLDFLNFLHQFENYKSITIEEMLLLEELDLSYKNIKTLPKSIKVMVALAQLELNDNVLTELPVEIGELVNLEYFDCSRNKIISLPKSIENLKKLEFLYLGVNQLSEIPNFDQLANLEVVTLDNNNITEEAFQNSNYKFIIVKSIDEASVSDEEEIATVIENGKVRSTKLPNSPSDKKTDDDEVGTILKDPLVEEKKGSNSDSDSDSDSDKKNKFIYWAIGITCAFLVCYFFVIPLFNKEGINPKKKVDTSTKQINKSTSEDWKNKFYTDFEKIKKNESNLGFEKAIKQYETLSSSFPKKANTEELLIKSRVDYLKAEQLNEEKKKQAIKDEENRKALKQAKLLKDKKERDSIANLKKIEAEKNNKLEYDKKLKIAKKLISFSGTIADCKKDNACKVNVTKKLNEALKIYPKGAEAKILLKQLQ